jgi:DNA-binding beta-propeller fold protein YncE
MDWNPRLGHATCFDQDDDRSFAIRADTNEFTKGNSFPMSTLKNYKLIGSAAVTLVLLLIAYVASAENSEEERGGSVLKEVAEIPLPGPPVRFDYQSLDSKNGRLYIAHMNADQLVVFDTQKRQVIANLDGFKRVHGVIAVPDANRVFASATGEHQMVAVEMNSLKILGAAGPINYPDGLAYSPETKRVFVSDEHGGVDAVVDAQTIKLITSIPLGGGAGNTIYDSGSGHILVAVHGANELVAIDPAAMKIVGRYKLPGIENPHGIALDLVDRLAFIAGEENHSLAVFDLKTMKLVSVHQVGDDPDVLSWDSGLGRLYVSAESGTVTVLQKTNRDVRSLGQIHMPHAHTVSVDSKTHLVYFPLENISGHPVLRIMRPADQ